MPKPLQIVTIKSQKNIIGSKLIELDTVDSTNNYAAVLLKETNVQNGTVILAHSQTEGKGQRGRKWHSGVHEDLTFSIVLKPEDLALSEQFYLSRAMALGIRDLIKKYVEAEVYIKWPNDIFVQDKKICGILIENEINGGLLAHSVVGIGINLSFSDGSVDFIHTSLERESDLSVERQAIFEDCLACLNKRYKEFVSRRFSRLGRDHANALYLKNEWAQFELRGDIVQAKILDVEDDGRLIVEHKDGSISSEGTGTIRHILYGTDISRI